jgi:hypothetical protein
MLEFHGKHKSVSLSGESIAQMQSSFSKIIVFYIVRHGPQFVVQLDRLPSPHHVALTCKNHKKVLRCPCVSDIDKT